MKHTIAMLAALLAFTAAQAEDFVRHMDQSNEFVCRVDGVDQAGTHATAIEAIERATNLKLSNPDLPVICDRVETIVAILTSAGMALVAEPVPDVPGSVTLSWSIPTKKADGTALQPGELTDIRIIQTSPGGRQFLLALPPTNGTHTIEDLPVGVQHCFVARAKTDVLSADSNEVCVTP